MAKPQFQLVELEVLPKPSRLILEARYGRREAELPLEDQHLDPVRRTSPRAERLVDRRLFGPDDLLAREGRRRPKR
jgi:hypothetical protein